MHVVTVLKPPRANGAIDASCHNDVIIDMHADDSSFVTWIKRGGIRVRVRDSVWGWGYEQAYG